MSKQHETEEEKAAAKAMEWLGGAVVLGVAYAGRWGTAALWGLAGACVLTILALISLRVTRGRREGAEHRTRAFRAARVAGMVLSAYLATVPTAMLLARREGFSVAAVPAAVAAALVGIAVNAHVIVHPSPREKG